MGLGCKQTGKIEGIMEKVGKEYEENKQKLKKNNKESNRKTRSENED